MAAPKNTGNDMQDEQKHCIRKNYPCLQRKRKQKHKPANNAAKGPATRRFMRWSQAKSNVCQQKNTCANKPRASVHFHSSSNSSAPMKVTLPPAQPGNAPREQPSAQPEGAPSSCRCLGPGCKESNNYDCTMRNNISNN